MVDMDALGASAFRRGGSSPSIGTKCCSSSGGVIIWYSHGRASPWKRPCHVVRTPSATLRWNKFNVRWRNGRRTKKRVRYRLLQQWMFKCPRKAHTQVRFLSWQHNQPQEDWHWVVATKQNASGWQLGKTSNIVRWSLETFGNVDGSLSITW